MKASIAKLVEHTAWTNRDSGEQAENAGSSVFTTSVGKTASIVSYANDSRKNVFVPLTLLEVIQ